jgi:hypothetical protein
MAATFDVDTEKPEVHGPQNVEVEMESQESFSTEEEPKGMHARALIAVAVGSHPTGLLEYPDCFS